MKLVRGLFALFCLVWLTGATWLPLFKTAGGGGGVSISALASGNSSCGSSTCTLVSSQTFAAGIVPAGIVTDLSGSLSPPTTVTINGVSATPIGSPVTDGTTSIQMWYATVGSGTGNIVLAAAGSIGESCLSSWTITGASSSTPTANNSFNGLVSTQADPQGPMSSLTVASGGVAALFIGGIFHTTTANPTTWVQASRDASLETGNGAGNQCAAAGGHISAAGTYTGITASGTVSWSYSAMLGAAWN